MTCDVLLGADGVRSPVRSVMLDFAAHDLGDEALRALAPAVWSGEAIYRALVSPARLAEEFAKMGGEGDHRVLKEHVMVSMITHRNDVFLRKDSTAAKGGCAGCVASDGAATECVL